MSDDQAAQNTDRDLWRGPDLGNGDFYADRIFITERGGIGFDVGGHCIVKPLRDWWELGLATTWEGPRIKDPHHGVGAGPIMTLQEGNGD